MIKCDIMTLPAEERGEGMGDMQIAVFLLLLFLAVLWDIRTHRIPNGLIVTGLLFSFLRVGLELGVPGLLFAGAGMLLPCILLAPLYHFRMIGAGDIKLLSLTGAFMGLSSILTVLVLSFLLGGVYAALIVLFRGNVHSRFFYLKTYITDYLKTGHRQSYIGFSSPDGLFCFSIPVFLAVLLTFWRGV